jgi:hypothetical protein
MMDQDREDQPYDVPLSYASGSGKVKSPIAAPFDPSGISAIETNALYRIAQTMILRYNRMEITKKNTRME